MGRRKKRPGHFCWSCGTYRPNERFSGKGHARHLCKDCQKLGQEELQLRQATRDIERLLDGGGRIRRKRRRELDRFLEHANPRVRAYAEQIVRDDAEMRETGQELVEDERAARSLQSAADRLGIDPELME